MFTVSPNKQLVRHAGWFPTSVADVETCRRIGLVGFAHGADLLDWPHLTIYSQHLTEWEEYWGDEPEEERETLVSLLFNRRGRKFFRTLPMFRHNGLAEEDKLAWSFLQWGSPIVLYTCHKGKRLHAFDEYGQKITVPARYQAMKWNPIPWHEVTPGFVFNVAY